MEIMNNEVKNMKNNKKGKNKTHETTKNEQQEFINVVNSHIDSFNLEKHSLDHERKPEEIGFNMKR